MARIPVHEVLVIVFRIIETPTFQLGGNRTREATGLIQQGDIAPGHAALGSILREDG